MSDALSLIVVAIIAFGSWLVGVLFGILLSLPRIRRLENAKRELERETTGYGRNKSN